MKLVVSWLHSHVPAGRQTGPGSPDVSPCLHVYAIVPTTGCPAQALGTLSTHAGMPLELEAVVEEEELELEADVDELLEEEELEAVDEPLEEELELVADELLEEEELELEADVDELLELELEADVDELLELELEADVDELLEELEPAPVVDEPEELEPAPVVDELEPAPDASNGLPQAHRMNATRIAMVVVVDITKRMRDQRARFQSFGIE